MNVATNKAQQSYNDICLNAGDDEFVQSILCVDEDREDLMDPIDILMAREEEECSLEY